VNGNITATVRPRKTSRETRRCCCCFSRCWWCCCFEWVGRIKVLLSSTIVWSPPTPSSSLLFKDLFLFPLSSSSCPLIGLYIAIVIAIAIHPRPAIEGDEREREREILFLFTRYWYIYIVGIQLKTLPSLLSLSLLYFSSSSSWRAARNGGGLSSLLFSINCFL